VTHFDSFALPDPLQRAVADLGFTEATDIQRSAIPALLDGRDVVGIAQTGTGKTAAFGLPLLAQVTPEERHVQGLVLTPTRELAIQVADAIASFAAHTHVEVVPVYGGASYLPQLRALKHGAQVVVGTPGRVMDLMERGALDLSQLRVFVLDEADEMLRMGFAEDVETIAASIPTERITALFSATMPDPIARVAATHLRDPLRVEVTPAASTVENTEQLYAVVPFRFKVEALARVLSVWREEAALVFVRTRSTAEEVAVALATLGVRASSISGDVAQAEREKLIERLRQGALDVLVATDVAARGLDVERIGLVVNYDVPREAEAYVHRIGRTGRAGRKGRALTFFTPKEHDRLRTIERLTHTQLTEVTVPTPDDVVAHRVQRVLATLPMGDLASFRDAVLATGADPVDLAAALLARAVGTAPQPVSPGGRARREEHLDEHGNFISAHFEGRGDPRVSRVEGKAPRAGRGREPREFTRGALRYRIEVGHRDGVKPGAIVGALTGDGRIDGRAIGRIDIYPSFSLVELESEPSDDAIRRLQKSRVAGRALRMAPDLGPRTERPHRPERSHRADRPYRGERPRGDRRRFD